MIIIYSESEIKCIEQANIIARKAIFEVAKYLRPEITTFELDCVAEEYIKKNGGIPSFKGYMGFPGNICISINEEVIHGIPSKNRYIKDGDLVSIDIGVLFKGYYGDTAHTFGVGKLDQNKKNILRVGEKALEKGIEQAVPGNRIGDISNAIQMVAEENNYNVVRDYVGHGVGKHVHEDPQVPNYGTKGYGLKLKKGNVIALEPMINMGSYEVEILEDGWTVKTVDNSLSVHFEKSIAIVNNGNIILSHL